MRDTVTMRVEFDIAAQKCLNQVMIHNERIEQQLEEGIKRAFEEFDFVEYVSRATQDAIKAQIKDSSSWGKLRELVKRKADEIVEAHIEKQMEKWRNEL
jgi:hypothetical protein